MTTTTRTLASVPDPATTATTAGRPKPYSLAGATLSHGPRATQVISDDHYAVELDLTPIARPLLTDLTRALKGHAHDLVLLSRLPVTDPAHGKILDRLMADPHFVDAFRLPIHPGEAEILSNELHDAKDEPTWCEHCHESYADGGLYCTACDDGLSARGPVRGA